MTNKEHWENIYLTKQETQVSWYQARPTTSLEILQSLNLPKTSSILDVGGGESRLVDELLDLGYERITVLDISEQAILRAKKRLGAQAQKVNWVVSSILEFSPQEKFDFWHDRAVFHFLTEPSEIESYVDLVRRSVPSRGYLSIGTFSEKGPDKCSGLVIKKYSETSMTNVFSKDFIKLKCFQVDHQTPSNTVQNFLFCCFRKI